VLIAVGVITLGLAHRSSPPLIVAGMLATISGSLLITPLAVRALATSAGSMPVAVRLALRDLGRYRARSSSALAAISLALGIAAAVVVVSNAEARKAAAQPPNLSNRQIRIYPGPSALPDLPTPRTPTELARLSTQVWRMATQLDHAAVTRLMVASEPGVRPQGSGNALGIPTMQLTTLSGSNTYSTASVLYVATPAVLYFLKIDPATVAPRTNFLVAPTLKTTELSIPDLTSRKSLKLTGVQRIRIARVLLGYPDASNRLAPPSFVTVEAPHRLGWKPVPSGWLLETRRPLAGIQLANARSLAAQAGLTIETRRKINSLSRVIGGAVAAGALLALAILAMTTGLIRSEAAGDLRTLHAIGATNRTRRTLTAATAAALALLGTLLGIGGAYVTLLAVYLNNVRYLSHTPILYLALMAIGVPAVAASASWLLAGQQPTRVTRPAIE
jgi:putative ABC transport system permease protein